MTDNRFVPLPVGTWLLHDPDDVRMERDFSVWRRLEYGGTTLLVDWFGMIQEEKADHMMPSRFIWVMLTDEHLAQLQMAAAHGQFRRVAKQLWERIMR